MPANKPDNLERWPHERVNWHRALLLWAMQAPDLRSQRAVARSLGASEGSIRNWAKANRWKHRAASHGPESDQLALDMYREEYLTDFGRLELPHVAPNIVRALGALDPDDPAQAAADLTRERVLVATGKTLKEVSQATAQVARTQQRDNKKEAERHVRLVDGALGVIAKKMKANEIRVSVRDIPVLLECREKLVRVMDGTANTGAHVAVESARVKYAKETGGDLLLAMYEDAEECVLILGALQARQAVDLQALSDENKAVQGGAVRE